VARVSTVLRARDAQDVVKAGLPLCCNIRLSVRLGSAKTHLYCNMIFLIKLLGILTLRGVAPPLYTVAIIVVLVIIAMDNE